MPLLDRNKWPPGGFPYREPSLNWSAPNDGLGFDLRVGQIQAVRLANPSAGLDPSWEACQIALDVYTCTRIKNDPAWCVSGLNPVAIAFDTARKIKPRCATCGGGGRRR